MSKNKPDMSSSLKLFADKMQGLFVKGVSWHHNESVQIMNGTVIAPVATLDAPARAAPQNLMQYNEEYGCSLCEHPGETCAIGSGNNHPFLSDERNHPLRTKERMLSQARKALNEGLEYYKAVKGFSIISKIHHFDVSKAFLTDHMHAVLIGVMVMLLLLWCSTYNKYEPYYVKKRDRDESDKLLSEIKPPGYVPRTPRDLKNLGF